MDGSDAPAAPFTDPRRTAKGERRAAVAWRGLKTLWLNTGTLCNIACANCYIESSPANDRLVYLTLADVTPFLDEIEAAAAGPVEIGITGGEPFMCPAILDIMAAALARGHSVLVLTNAMRPMMRPRLQAGLLALNAAHPGRLTLRVSLDHHTRAVHDQERAPGAFDAALKGLAWLTAHGFDVAIAGRLAKAGEEAADRAAYAALAARIGLDIEPGDARRLVLFPEMAADDAPPEISEACWDILGRDPGEVMCAGQRMVIRRKGAARATLAACTLLPYAPEFELGETLAEATAEPVALNHPWCASFCVLGGGSCSA